ncbi:hypothetical protein KEM56_001402 [Ascosphaera pollenicola]|nr:hypothetical protein KEM56_001402 [Ascosphaera pollenicola]
MKAFPSKAGVASAAKKAWPGLRATFALASRPRVLVAAVLTVCLLFVVKGMGREAEEMQKFFCYGPPKPPSKMNPNELSEWQTKLQTPVVFNNPHTPININTSSIEVKDLNAITSTPKAVQNEERVLILTPLRDAAPYLEKYFDLISQLTYPHHLIDLGFLVSDSSDDTLGILSKELERVQSMPDRAFHNAVVVKKDFGETLDMAVESRHGFEAQAPRRKAIGKARNFLLYSALKPEHSWVYWRDVDIVDSPEKIIEDFVAHDKDVLVPNIWYHQYEDGRDIEGRFDYNSWQESETGLKLAASLPKDTVLVEGYKEFDTKRKYLVSMGDWRKNKDEEVHLDGIGGVNIIVKADVHRAGINFPCYAFENQAETEGFGKMANRAGYQVVGLPNYVVWHISTNEKSNLGGRKAY